MGIYWRNVSYWWVRFAPDDLSLCRFFRRRSIGSAFSCRDHCAHLHAYLSKHGDDDCSAPHHRCTIAINQLQRLVCANDHVWPRAGEQRLDSPENSCVRRLWLVACKGSCQLPLQIAKITGNTWKLTTRSSWRFSKGRSIYCFTSSSRMRSIFTTFRLNASLVSTSSIFKRSKN